MTAATRLEAALLEAAEALMAVVGLPSNPADGNSPRRPVNGSLVNRDEVPATARKSAVFALDVLMCGIELMDPDSAHSQSVEDGLAAMERGEGS